MTFETPPLPILQATLSDPSTPIAKRMRATYYLRQLYDDTNNNNSHNKTTLRHTIIDTLCSQLVLPSHGALLRHEFAYVLGQLRNDRACPTLESMLTSSTEDVMVRHECAEALGAIGSPSSIPILQSCSNDESIEVGQTCQLAVEFLSWKLKGGNDDDNDAPIACACMTSPYNSHDPAPPHPSHAHLSSIQIGEILNNVNEPLFTRFRAMFSLRNKGDEQSVHELGRALVNDTSSTLLRHEVAYVMGQLGHPSCVEFLVSSLKKREEHKMVRHESAEALGAIEERWGECETVLREFLDDEDEVVRESCVVALDAADYFGYSDGNGGEKNEDPEEEEENDKKGINFSMHKAKSDGKVDGGVLLNHFNIVA